MRKFIKKKKINKNGGSHDTSKCRCMYMHANDAKIIKIPYF